MSYTLTVDVIGAKEMKRAFAAAPKVVGNELKDALAKTAYIVEGRAKSYAPIQYGFLRGSIHTEGPYVTANNVEAKVGTNIKYALYQEKGTGIYAGRGMIRPRRAKILAWKQNGKWVFARAVRGVRGKWYMKRARNEAMPFLSLHLKAAMAKITHHLAKG